MNARLSTLRRNLRWLGIPLSLLLATVLFTGGVHHHAGIDSHGTCVICTLSHAPATETLAVAEVQAPARAPERVVVRTPLVLRRIATASASSRAPPQA